jgi:hypothetical protein
MPGVLRVSLPRISPLDGRAVLAASVVGYFSLLLVLASLRGWAGAWRILGVPSGGIRFSDMVFVTSGWECERRGLDVLVANPCDPFHRLINYPRVWMTPEVLGLGQPSADALAVVAGVLFFAVAISVPGRLTALEGLAAAALLLSPSVMLAVERGNNDLVVFTLVGTAVAAIRSKRVGIRRSAAALLLLATVLKLYPLFASIALLRRRPKEAIYAVAAVVGAAAVYAVIIRRDLSLISDATPRPFYLSYGAAVTLDEVRVAVPGLAVVSPLDRTSALAAQAFLVAVTLVLGVMAGGLMRRSGIPQGRGSETRMTAFYAGAGVYVGTFALGYNWDYRLIFTTLALPQMLLWTRQRGAMRPASAAAVFGLILVAWISNRSVLNLPFPDDIVHLLLCLYFVSAVVFSVPPWLARIFDRPPHLIR